MTFPLNSYSMNNSLIGLFQNGLSCFGNSGYGGFSGFSLWGMSGSPFTNCYGQVDYDAVAGYGVANALMGVATQATNHYLSQRETKVNYNEEIKNIQTEISNKQTKKLNLRSDKNTAQESINSIQTEINNLNSQIDGKNIEIEKLKNRLSGLDVNSDEYKNLTAQISQKESNLKKLNNDLQEKKEKIDSYTGKINSLDEQIKALDTEISQLNIELKKYQEALNNEILDKADGNKFKRTSEDDYAKKVVDGKLVSDSYSEKDLRTAINHFMNAVDKNDKKAKAKIVVNIYNKIPEDQKNTTLKQAAEIAYKYAC